MSFKSICNSIGNFFTTHGNTLGKGMQLAGTAAMGAAGIGMTMKVMDQPVSILGNCGFGHVGFNGGGCGGYNLGGCSIFGNYQYSSSNSPYNFGYFGMPGSFSFGGMNDYRAQIGLQQAYAYGYNSMMQRMSQSQNGLGGIYPQIGTQQNTNISGFSDEDYAKIVSLQNQFKDKGWTITALDGTITGTKAEIGEPIEAKSVLEFTRAITQKEASTKQS